MFTWVKNHKWLTAFVTIGTVLIALIVFGVTRPKQVEYVTSLAERGDLRQTVEAVGTVISERDLQLQFPRSGVLDLVLVNEGDYVRAGQTLARLRAGSEAADIASASARVASAEADLRAMREGSRPEDIAITEAQLENSRAQLAAAEQQLQTAETAVTSATTQLEILQAEADTNLSGERSVATSTIAGNIATGESALSSVESVWDDPSVQDAVIKSDPAKYDAVRRQIAGARTLLSQARTAATQFNDPTVVADTARRALSATSDVVRMAFDTINQLPVTGYFTESEKNEKKSTLAAERSNTENAIRNVDTAVKTLHDASATYDTRIASQEASLASAEGARDKALSDIRTFESSVRTQQAQLDLKRAGNRPTDIASAEARVREQRAALARAAASYRDMILIAPIAGQVTNVAAKPGEYTPVGPFITMLGTSPYRVEMFVSEVDIPKVHVTQSGSIELDAFPGIDYKLRVGEIDPAATDVSGVPKYRIKLDYVYPHDEFKIGMTGDAEIVTGERKDVMSVSRRAVLDGEKGKYVRILKEDQTAEERPVTLGMEDASGKVEVISGVKEGEVVIELIKE